MLSNYLGGQHNNIWEFYDWILTLKPEDVKDKGISKQTLSYARNQIRKGIILNPKTKIVKYW